MIHSIVVAVDSTDSSRQAQTFALDLAKRFSATVTGVAVLDVPWIKRPMAMPIGGGAYRMHRDETLITQHTAELSAKMDAFEKLCTLTNVACRSIEAEGSPSDKLDLEAEQHDLMVLGRDTNFHGHRGHDVGEVTDKLLRDHPRPVIMVPPDAPLEGKGVVVCFDGSLPASRAMHMFYLLGLAKDQPVHVVSVNDDPALAEATANRGATFFRNRGVEVTAHGISGDDDSNDIAMAIFHLAESVGADMVVMGAYAEHSIWRQLIVGSVTRQLLRACPVPLFVHY